MRKLFASRVLAGLAGVLVSCGASAWSLREGASYLLGEEEYVYGFPLVMPPITRVQ